MPIIPFARKHEDAYPPTVKHPGDAGMDFYCRWHTEIEPHGQVTIETGILVEIPPGFVGLLKPKGGQEELIGSGVIEWTYQGEIIFRVVNISDQKITIRRGDPIGQMIIVENLEPEPVEVDLDTINMELTARGATGGILQASGE